MIFKKNHTLLKTMTQKVFLYHMLKIFRNRNLSREKPATSQFRLK